MPTSNAIKILFLAANPEDTAQLRIDKEVREIKQALLTRGLDGCRRAMTVAYKIFLNTTSALRETARALVDTAKWWP